MTLPLETAPTIAMTQHLELVLALEQMDNPTSGFGKFVGPRHPVWNDPDRAAYHARNQFVATIEERQGRRSEKLSKRKLRRMRAKQ